LILRDETLTFIKHFRKRRDGSSAEELCASSLSNIESPSIESEKSASVNNEVSNCRQLIPYPDINDPLEWFPGNKIQMISGYEKNQIALFCCRETVNLRTLSWIMSDEKWVDLLPEMIGRSDALTSVIHANAATYPSKMAGAISTPRQALTNYAKALKELQ